MFDLCQQPPLGERYYYTWQGGQLTGVCPWVVTSSLADAVAVYRW